MTREQAEKLYKLFNRSDSSYTISIKGSAVEAIYSVPDYCYMTLVDDEPQGLESRYISEVKVYKLVEDWYQ